MNHRADTHEEHDQNTNNIASENGQPQNIESKRKPLRDSFTTNVWVLLTVITGIILFALWHYHKIHTIAAIPYVFIVALFGMHLFMHGGHGGHDHGKGK